jgi:hypothetical protein
MITRRTFLKATASTATGLILPSWLVKAENYIDAVNEPFLEPPERVDKVVYAVDCGANDYYLSLGKPRGDIPSLTWRYLFEHWYDFDSFEEYFGTDDPEDLKGYNLDDLAPEEDILDYWVAEGSEYARAHEFLNNFDLGVDFRDENGVGEIEFVRGSCPGNDSTFVTVPDHLSISLLQKRLNQIDGTIEVVFHDNR